jgi:hypothetical protein
LLGIAVHLDDRVVHVDPHRAGQARQHAAAADQADQEPRRDPIELPDVPEAELPQERPQRRGGIGPVEHLAHRAVPQQRHVVDRVGTGDHPGDQRGHLPAGVRALVRRHRQQLIGQRIQPGVSRQAHQRNQSGGRHQIRLVEARRPTGSV